MNTVSKIPGETSSTRQKSPLVQIAFELPEVQALAFLEFLRRAGYSDYRICAVSDNQAYEMLRAGEQLRSALGECLNE